MDAAIAPRLLFCYGTLLPGDVRWPLLSAFVVDEGFDDAVGGHLFDTGLGYPAAIFDDTGTALVIGRTFALLETSLARALEVLDDEEDTVDGLYRRVEITTAQGHRAWAYAYGTGLELSPIDSGDWLGYRGLRTRLQ
jgi:gamma-glutamylcyclotransferase (GGCT)/AIG2-like uncharacterized protein YtfP